MTTCYMDYNLNCIQKEGQVTTKVYATPIQPLTTPIDIIKTTPTNQVTIESDSFSPKDIRDLSEVVSSLKPMLEEEREVLREIQEDREEYREVRLYLPFLLLILLLRFLLLLLLLLLLFLLLFLLHLLLLLFLLLLSYVCLAYNVPHL